MTLARLLIVGIVLTVGGCVAAPPIAIKSTSDALLGAKVKLADYSHDRAKAIVDDARVRCATQPEDKVRECRHQIADAQLDALDASVDKLRVAANLAGDAVLAARAAYEASEKGAQPKRIVTVAVAAMLVRWQDLVALYTLVVGGAP